MAAVADCMDSQDSRSCIPWLDRSRPWVSRLLTYALAGVVVSIARLGVHKRTHAFSFGSSLPTRTMICWCVPY